MTENPVSKIGWKLICNELYIEVFQIQTRNHPVARVPLPSTPTSGYL